MAEMTPHALRMLYRSMLRAAAQYPSVKRESIYQTIRESWRENKHIDNPKLRAYRIQEALFSLRALSRYTQINPKAPAKKISF